MLNKRKGKRKKSKSAKAKSKRVRFSAAGAITAVCLIAVVLAAALAPKPISGKKDFFETEKEYVSGIDVSHHNGKIDWSAAAEEYDFAIIRVGYRGYGEGSIAGDSRFKENIKAANEAGIPVGVYFYSQATTKKEARAEAEYALSQIEGYDVQLPVFIDYEYAFDKDGMHCGRLFDAHLTREEAAELIDAFCSKIKRSGHYAGVYASSWVMDNEIEMSRLDDDVYVWVADYNKSVTYSGEYDLWQYTKTGQTAAAQSVYTDFNRWYAGR